MSRWAPVALLAVGCGVAVARVEADHALAIQVTGAVTGAVIAVGGASLTAAFWSRRNESELIRLTASLGFFLACVGVVAIGVGAGFLH